VLNAAHDVMPTTMAANIIIITLCHAFDFMVMVMRVERILVHLSWQGDHTRTPSQSSDCRFQASESSD